MHYIIKNMRKKSKIVLIILVCLAVLAAILFLTRTYKISVFEYMASLVFPEKITPENLKENYKNNNLKILIVPGHDKISYGAQYRGATEESLNARLAEILYDYLSNDRHFSVFTTRAPSGEYNKWFLEYSEKEKSNVTSFRNKLKTAMKSLVKTGAVTKNTKVYHNPAADNTSLNLYTINKWANENNIDLVLHIHFNDYPGRAYDLPGKYNGFAIYIPERQLPNYRTSKEIAESIKNNLETISKPSNYKKEKDTTIEDQQLIAVGSNASRDGASILIEYSYIYEDKIYDKNLRDQTLANMAYKTYLGLKNYFDLTPNPSP